MAAQKAAAERAAKAKAAAEAKRKAELKKKAEAKRRAQAKRRAAAKKKRDANKMIPLDKSNIKLTPIDQFQMANASMGVAMPMPKDCGCAA